MATGPDPGCSSTTPQSTNVDELDHQLPPSLEVLRLRLLRAAGGAAAATGSLQRPLEVVLCILRWSRLLSLRFVWFCMVLGWSLLVSLFCVVLYIDYIFCAGLGCSRCVLFSFVWFRAGI